MSTQLKAADITKILGRPPKTSLDLWLDTFKAAPGDTKSLTTTECWRLYQKWYEASPRTQNMKMLSPEEWGHEMKERGFVKRATAVKGRRRDVYILNETAAHLLLAAHRADPTPKNYHISFDIKKYRDMGLLAPVLEDDSPLNPWPPGYWDEE